MIAAGVVLAAWAAGNPTLRWPWWISAGLIAGRLARCRLPSLGAWFLSSYLLLFYFTPAIAGLSTRFSVSILEAYVWMTVVGAHLFSAIYGLVHDRAYRRGKTGGWSPTAAVERLEARQYLLFGSGVFAALLAISLAIIDAGSLGELLSRTRVQAKLDAGPLTTLSIYFIGLANLATITYPAVARSRPYFALVGLSTVAAASGFYFFVLRQRSVLVALIVSLLVGVFVFSGASARHGKWPRIGSVLANAPLKVLLSSLVLIGSTLAMFVVRIARGNIESSQGSLFPDMTLGEIIQFGVSVDADLGADIGYTPTVLRVMEIAADGNVHLAGSSFLRPLSLIPSLLFGFERPPETSRLVGSWFSPSGVLTIPPGIQGDLHLNFGMIGLVGFGVLGLLLGEFDRATDPAAFVLAGISFTHIFFLARGNPMNAIYMLLFSWVILRLLLHLHRRLPVAPDGSRSALE